ncbi:MAG: FimV/HubP family polar landmark protein [Pseudomonadota bacterium]
MAKRKRFGQVVAPALMLSLGMAPLSAQALGLGKLRVNSALGQPLSARFDLVGATAAEAEIATVSLASAEAHERMGVGSTLGGVTLRFEVKVGSDGRPYVAVSSYQPVREPYIEFIVEAISPTGQVARHYTVLLDPVGAPAAATPTATWSPPATGVATVIQPAAPRPRANPFANVGAPKAGAAWGPVPPGSTLWSIARRVRPSGADLDDVMSAIHRANPKAFIDGDPARLLAGSRLTIPAADAMRAPPTATPSPAEAAPPAGEPTPIDMPPAATPTRAEAAPAEPAAPTAPATGSDTTLADNQQAQGEVRVLRGEETSAAGATPSVSENRIQLLEEALDAAQQQSASLEVRMKALEEQINTLTQLAKGNASTVEDKADGTAQSSDGSPAVPAEAASTEPTPTVAAAVTPAPAQQPTPPASTAEDSSSGSRAYGLAAAAGVGLAGLLLWARRRQAATAIPEPEPANAVVQTTVHAPAAAPEPVVSTQSPVASTAPDETTLAVADDGFGDPVDTQIDLLTAYVGMADGPSARQIYEEIQRTGNAAQKAQATALLARLDA